MVAKNPRVGFFDTLQAGIDDHVHPRPETNLFDEFLGTPLGIREHPDLDTSLREIDEQLLHAGNGLAPEIAVRLLGPQELDEALPLVFRRDRTVANVTQLESLEQSTHERSPCVEALGPLGFGVVVGLPSARQFGSGSTRAELISLTERLLGEEIFVELDEGLSENRS
ncbi:MAG: hypothetical protein QM784_13250 [Polyangiaceae bacterium]